MTDPTTRVLRLLSLLQTHVYWSGQRLADELEVSERTLRRDIDRLRGLGYPVEAIPGISGGYRLAAGAHMPPLLLDDDEAVAIAVGLRTVAGAPIAGIEDISLRALAKLEQILPDRLRRRVNAMHTNVAVLGPGPDASSVDVSALALLSQACRDREELRFDYRRRDGDESRRLVQPHQLVSVGRRWYLVAWDVRRGDWRTFRIDRLAEPELAGVRFAPRELPATDAAAFVAESLRSMPLPHAATVTVDGPDDEIEAVAKWFGATVDTGPDGRRQVTLRSDSVDWLAGMVALVGVHFDIEVEADPALIAVLDTLGARLGRLRSQ